MDFWRVKEPGRLWRATAGLLAAVVFWACCGQLRVQAAVRAEDVEKFVRNYYEAWGEGDLSAIQAYVEAEPMEMMALQALFETMQEWGVQGYNVLTVDVYPMEHSDWWVAVVVYDLITDQSALPGCVCESVYMPEDGNGLIYLSNDSMDSAVLDEISRFVLQDEVLEQLNEVNQRYYDVITENPEVLNWVMDFESAMAQRRMGLVNGEERSGEQEESEGQKDELYVVKRGDCLWHIAEDKLGDGTRWEELYEANRDIIGDDPNLILIDMEIKIR